MGAALRRRRVVVAGLVALVALGLAFLLVPPPGARTLHCRPGDFDRIYQSCSEVTGRVVYIERVDPDGDGDTHVVLVATESTTWPAVSVLKLKARSSLDDRVAIGRWVSAVGYEYEGEHGRRVLRVLRLARG